MLVSYWHGQLSLFLILLSLSLMGFSEDLTFGLFINGYDWNLNPVGASEYLERGSELKLLLDAWLSKW